MVAAVVRWWCRGDGDGIDNDPTDPDANSSSGYSHGTHVATTIGSKNDGVGLNGMAVKVLPLRVFPADGGGGIPPPPSAGNTLKGRTFTAIPFNPTPSFLDPIVVAT